MTGILCDRPLKDEKGRGSNGNVKVNLRGYNEIEQNIFPTLF